jgi:hypothetical protein
VENIIDGGLETLQLPLYGVASLRDEISGFFNI